MLHNFFHVDDLDDKAKKGKDDEDVPDSGEFPFSRKLT
jgi:hypothetical protein